MPAKVTERADGFREVDRWPAGVGWLAHPGELMQRAGHALATDDGVWVVDPVDAAGLDDLLAEFGEVVGVAVLLGFHARDAGEIATRHGVPVSVPAWVDRVEGLVDAPVERFEEGLPGTGYRALRLTPNRLWREAALYRERDGTLVVPESVGTGPYFTVGDERLGVSVYRRLSPPRGTLGGLDPERVLCGHGPGVHDGADEALADALAGSRRRAPRALAANLPTQLRALRAAVLD